MRVVLYLIVTSFLANSAFGLPSHDNTKEFVVFDVATPEGKLSGSTAEVTAEVRQSSILNVQGTAKVVIDRGRSTNRIDVVFLGDGYNSSELTEFSQQVLSYSTGLISQEPFQEYSEFFNIHRVDIPSNDSGVDNDGEPGTLKDTVLDTEFWCSGNQSNLCTNVSKAWSYAALARDFDHVIVLANSSSPGSTAYPFSDLTVVSALQPQNIENLLHQLGHSFGNLADEFETGSWPTYTGFEPAEANVSPQNSASMTSQNIKWAKWLGVTALGKTIGTHEGAMGHQYGIYRPTLTSKMRELNEPFNAPSVEAIIKQIYKKVKPIDASTPTSNDLTGQNTLSVTPMATRSSTLKIQWFIDSTPISGATKSTFRPNEYPLTDGVHNVRVEVTDTTPWIKDETFRNLYMKESRNWNVLIDQNAPIITQHPSSVTAYPNSSTAMTVQVTGDDLNFQWFKNGAAISGANNRTITISPVTRNQSGDQYWVIISNVAGSVRSNTATLNVANRSPQYSGQSIITTYRDASAGFSFTVSDPDGDPLSVTSELDANGASSGAIVSVTNNRIDLRAGINFIGTFNLNLVVSDQIKTVKIPVIVTILNRPPAIAAIANQSTPWGSDFISVNLNGSDPDYMDTLVYTATVPQGNATDIKLRLNGNELTIDPKQGFTGEFPVTVSVSDGRASSQTQFLVNWSNGAPVIPGIPTQRMFYKNDSLNVPLNISDPDNDSLTIAAKVISGASNLALTVSNDNLTINPAPRFKGTSQIQISAYDGNITTTQNFTFESYNSSPVLQAIPNQKASPQKNEIIVPFIANDPDPQDTVTTIASLSSQIPQQLTVNNDDKNIYISATEPFQSNFQIKVVATDGDLSVENSFNVTIKNSAPVLETIPEIKIHPLKEDIKTIDLVGVDSDNDSLQYSVSFASKSLESLASLWIEGNLLKINPVNDYLGSYDIKVSVTDGIATSTQIVKVTAYNNSPEIGSICDQIVDSTGRPLIIPISVSDIDNDALSYEVLFEVSNLAYEVNSKYNFALVSGALNFNIFGKREKYLTATVNGQSNTSVFITENGSLYQAGESFERSILLEKLIPIFYQNPTILVDAINSSTRPPLSGVIENNEIKINVDSAYNGLAIVRIRAHDGFTFNEESFLLAVNTNGSGSTFKLGEIPNLRSHWKEDKLVVELPIEGNLPNSDSISVTLADTAEANRLDKLYNFAFRTDQIYSNQSIPRNLRPIDNQAGRDEKYFIGFNMVNSGADGTASVATRFEVYAILPDGSIYRCYHDILGKDSATAYSLARGSKIGKVLPVFYQDIDLLISPPNQIEPNVRISIFDNTMEIDTEDGFIGKVILQVSTGNGFGATQLVIFDKYNSIPVIDPAIPCSGEVCDIYYVNNVEFSYSDKILRLPITAKDFDPEDPNVAVDFYAAGNFSPYSQFDKYDLRPETELQLRYNEDGWREFKMPGVFNKIPTEFAILPTGAFYANWSGSPESSTFVRYVSQEVYFNPLEIDGRKFTSDSLDVNSLKNIGLVVEGNTLVVTFPDDFTVGNGSEILLVGEAVDGLSMGESRSRIVYRNRAPVVGTIPHIDLHWRENSITIPLSISDPDSNDELLPRGNIEVPFNQSNGFPGRLTGYSLEGALNIAVDQGIPKTFFPNLKVTDKWGKSALKQFTVHIYNRLPTLKPIGPKTFQHNQNQNSIQISGSDSDQADKGNLKYFVHPGTPAQYAGNLFAKYKLKRVATGMPVDGITGSDEFYFLGELDGKERQFAVFPTGALYFLEDGIKDENLLGFFPKSAITSAYVLSTQPVSNFNAASASINGDNITFERNNVPLSPASQKFTIWVSDGIEASYETIDVTWQDRSPILPKQNLVEGHWRNGSLGITGFQSIDVDGDPVTYTVIDKTGLGNYINIQNNTLSVTPNINQVGTQVVEVTARSTSYVVKGNYSFNFTNHTPYFRNTTVKNVGYKEDVSFSLDVVDQDQDPLTKSVKLVGTNAAGYQASITDNTLNVKAITPTPGILYAVVTVSDGVSEVQGSYSITYVNRAPVIIPFSSINMKWFDKSRSLPITVTDPDDDLITLSASIPNTPNAASANINNKILTVDLLKYVPNFVVNVVARDQINKVETTLSVYISNIVPQIAGIPASKNIHWRNDSFTIPFTANDQDGDQLVLDAKIVDNNFPAVPSITGNTLKVALPERKVGKFIVEVGADDKVHRSTSRMSVEVTNQIPTLAELSNVFIAEGTSERIVTLEGRDSDNDPLNFAAKIVTPEQIAFELNEIHHFSQGNSDFSFNRLGNAEKYLKGRRTNATFDSEYVIYPNGRMYLWTGILTTSTYLGTVPNAYYKDPTKLIGALPATGSESGVKTSIENNILKLHPDPGFVGTVWVYASVSDTRDTSGIFFSVTIEEPNDANDPARCGTSAESYDGEYVCGGTQVFVAEGTIGDSASGLTNIYNEIGISKNANGSFQAGESLSYSWKTGQIVPFSITYDPETRVANFILNGSSVRHSVGELHNISDFIITANRSSKLSSLTLSGLKLNGVNLNSTIAVSNTTSMSRSLKVHSPRELRKKFTLEGTAQMYFVSGVIGFDLGFKIAFIKAADAPTDCEPPTDDGNEDDGDDDSVGDGIRKLKICHILNGDSTKAKTSIISKDVLEAHLRHGDIIGECPGQPNDAGDPANSGRTCEEKQVFSSPNYSLWNSFLGMVNILELTNGNSVAVPVTVSFYSINGVLLDQRIINVAAHNQFDLIINDLRNFSKDSYGIVKLEFVGNIDGRMSFYRPVPNSANFDFAYSIPLSDATFGITAVGFNTFQPSTKLNEINNIVANWLSIVNLDEVPRTFSIFSYDTLGKLLLRREVAVPSFGRADIDGGHGIAGPNVVGFHKIVPLTATSEYIAQITRFGGDAPAGFASSGFKFAVPLSSKLGQSDPIFMPISNKFDQANWIEVVNILDKEVRASINYYSQGGEILESVDAIIKPNSQLHFNASGALPAGSSGFAVVVPFEPYSIIAQSMGYMREPNTGSITSISASQARRALPCAQSGSYNLFLGMENWLSVGNTTNETVVATILFSGPNSISEKVVVLTPKATSLIQIHNNPALETAPNTYGLISVYPKDSSVRLFSEVLRLRYRANGNPDISVQVPVR